MDWIFETSYVALHLYISVHFIPSVLQCILFLFAFRKWYLKNNLVKQNNLLLEQNKSDIEFSKYILQLFKH